MTLTWLKVAITSEKDPTGLVTVGGESKSREATDAVVVYKLCVPLVTDISNVTENSFATW